MSRWTLYVDESGEFPTWEKTQDPEFDPNAKPRRAVAGVLVRDGLGAAAGQAIREKLESIAPWATWPFHRTIWMQPLSHVFWWKAHGAAALKLGAQVPKRHMMLWAEAHERLKSAIGATQQWLDLERWSRREGVDRLEGFKAVDALSDCQKMLAAFEPGLSSGLYGTAASWRRRVDAVFRSIVNTDHAVPLAVSEAVPGDASPLSRTDDAYLRMLVPTLLSLAIDHVIQAGDDSLAVHVLRRRVRCWRCDEAAEDHQLNAHCIYHLAHHQYGGVPGGIPAYFGHPIEVHRWRTSKWGPDLDGRLVWADWISNASCASLCRPRATLAQASSSVVVVPYRAGLMPPRPWVRSTGEPEQWLETWRATKVRTGDTPVLVDGAMRPWAAESANEWAKHV